MQFISFLRKKKNFYSVRESVGLSNFNSYGLCCFVRLSTRAAISTLNVWLIFLIEYKNQILKCYFYFQNKFNIDTAVLPLIACIKNSIFVVVIKFYTFMKLLPVSHSLRKIRQLKENSVYKHWTILFTDKYS